MAQNKKIRVGITHGDINGIGYEVIMKALEDPLMTDLCTPIVYGSSKALSYHRKALEMGNVNFTLVPRAEDAADGVNNLVEVVDGEVRIELGSPSEAAGKAALAALKRAADDLRNGIIDVMVTAPMAQVPEAITKDAIVEKLEIFNDSLKKDFDIIKPRIAVLSLNPHAGENGMLGTEEKEVITPAIEEAYSRKIMAFGPYAADGFFGSGQYTHFDGVLAMYHDQGLAPFKTIAMDDGVNFTAGLPYVRTSPDHGTGYDIAGKNQASEASLRSAIFKAIDIFRNRMRFYEMNAHPLRRQYYDKSGDKEVLDLTKDDDESSEILNA